MIDLERGLVRVLDGRRQTMGAGFVVRADDETYRILTCAHVVLDAAGLPKDAAQPATVEVAFLSAPDEPPVSVTVDAWRAVGAGDIAVLRLDNDLPAGVEALPLGHAEHALRQEFETRGFPANVSDDMIAGGRIRGFVSNAERGRLLQLERGAELTAGFSGAPVLARAADRVVGMVSSITLEDKLGGGETTIAVPTEELQEVCKALRPSDVCPYRGLQSFTKRDARFFVGREAIIKRLEAELSDPPRALVLLGLSGSGKSSLVRAGLVPRLEGEAADSQGRSGSSWKAEVTRPTEALPADPASAGGLIDGPRKRVDAARASAPPTDRLLLVIDQFEELLAHPDTAARDMYLAELLAIIDEDAEPVCVLLVMRSDFYSRLSIVAPRLLERIEKGIVNVPEELVEDELERIIQEPAERVGLGFERGLVGRIVKEAITEAPSAGVPGAARSTVLALLEAALYDLWEGREEGLLTDAKYTEIGGFTGALPRRAATAYRVLGRERQPVARRILTGLVHVARDQQVPDTRRPRNRADLAAEAGDGAEAIIEQLRGQDARLIEVRGDDAEATIELVHDVLIEEWFPRKTRSTGEGLRQWVDGDRDELRFRQDVADDAQTWSGAQISRADGRVRELAEMDAQQARSVERDSDAYLLRGDRLDRALQLHGWPPDSVVPRFIATSQAARVRARRLRNAVFAIVTLLAVVSMLFGTWAIDQKGQAEHQEQVARSRQLAAQSLAWMPERFDLSLLLGVEAFDAAAGLEPAEGVEARAALLAAQLHEPRTAAVIRSRSDAIAFSPDNSLLASLGQDGVRLWSRSAETLGRPLGELIDWPPDIRSIAFQPGHDTLVTGHGDGRVRFWSTDLERGYGAPVGELTVGLPHYIRFEDVPEPGIFQGFAPVTSFAFSPDGSLLVSGQDDGIVRLWRMTGEATASSLGDFAVMNREDVCCADVIAGIAVSKKHQFVAALEGNPGTLSLWSMSGEASQPLEEHLAGAIDGVTSIAFHPDRPMLVAGTEEGTIRLWDLSDAAFGEPASDPLTGHHGALMDVAFSPDGLALASSGTDATIRLWDMSDSAFGEPLQEPLTGPSGRIETVQFGCDGTLLAASSDADMIRLWETSGQPFGTVFARLPGRVGHLEFNPDGSLLAAGSMDGSISLWDMADGATGEPLGTRVQGPGKEISGLAFHPDRPILGAAYRDGTIRLWTTSGEVVGQPLGEPLVDNFIDDTDLAFHPERPILAAIQSHEVKLWDISEEGFGTLLAEFSHNNLAPGLTFNRDGTLLAAGGSSGGLALWGFSGDDLGVPLADSVSRSGICVGCTSHVAFHPTRPIVASEDGGVVGLWDLSGDTLDDPLQDRRPTSRAMAFSPDGDVLVTADGGAIKLWDFAGSALGEPIDVEIGGGRGGAWSLAFRPPSGAVLASGSDDGTVILWPFDPDTWRERSCRRAGRELRADERLRFVPKSERPWTCLPSPQGGGDVASESGSPNLAERVWEIRPDGGALFAGRYAIQAAGSTIEFAIGKGWTADPDPVMELLRGDSYLATTQAWPDPSRMNPAIVTVLEASGTVFTSSCSADGVTEIDPTADAMAEYLASVAELASDPAEPVRVGGFDGLQVDAVVSSSLDCGEDHVLLFRTASEGVYGLRSGTQARLILLGINDRLLVIAIEAIPPVDYPLFLDDAMDLVTTIVIDQASAAAIATSTVVS